MPDTQDIPLGSAGDTMWMLLILALVAVIVALRWWRISRDQDRKTPPRD